MNLNPFYFSDLKEPQRTYRFRVSFIDAYGAYKPNGEPMPKLEYFDVSNISMPYYGFKKEVQKHGNFPRTFPVLDHDGFEITLLFEETRDHRVGKFINWLQRKIIQEDGIYNPPDKAKFEQMKVEILTDFDKVIAEYQFTNAYFLRVSNPVYDYMTSEILRYEIIFGSDIQNLQVWDYSDTTSRLPENLPLGILDNLRSTSNQS